MSTVLCIASHPDDELLGVGGTLLRHKAEGDTITIVIDKRCRDEGWQESFDAEAAMGIEYTRTPDRTLAELVSDLRPDVVYTHSLADLHADHRDLHERVLVACRPPSSVRAIYAFETPSATDWGMVPFRPVLFVDIEDHLTHKLRAMDAYRSELRPFPHPRNLDSLRMRAAYWGQRAGLHSAEAFEVIRERW